MKTLTIIRHAKSSWEQEGLSDFERPLNERGRRDAPVMAARLKQAVGQPELLVSSPALRAITTARVFADVLGISKDSIQLQSRIYEASVGTLLQIIQGFDDQYSHTRYLVITRDSASYRNAWPTAILMSSLPAASLIFRCR